MKKNYIFLLFIVFIICYNKTLIQAETKQEELEIIFTHDLHSHLDSFSIEKDGKAEVVGGFSRLKTVIERKKKENPNVVVVDAGDFSMGTLYQTIYQTEAAELRMLGALGVDVTTVGNHEFDYRDSGFADMLNAAKDSKDLLPEFVLSNINWENATEEQLKIKQAMDKFGVKPYTIIQKGSIKIGIFGIFGKSALEYAPMCELSFNDPVKSSKEIVKELKEKEKVDFILCLSHSGTSERKRDSEDEILAKKVPEIDLIVSGHTHTTLSQPIINENTSIVSSGEYGIFLGNIKLSKNEKNRWSVKNYQLIPINSTIIEDTDLLRKNQYFQQLIQEKYLDQYHYSIDEILAYNPVVFTNINEIGKKHQEEPLGNLIADSYIYAIKQAEGEQYEKIDMAVVPNGVIRESFVLGELTVEDAFNVSSLGIGKDKIPGYPLVSIYLTGKELKTVAEVDASISPIMDVAQLYISGLSFSFHPYRMILNRVTDVFLVDENNKRKKIEDKQLYRVVADLYTGQMLGAVEKKSFGILSIVPKTKEGKPIENLEDYIVYKNNQELKAWLAIAEYLTSFEKVDGVSTIPAYYETTHNRKVKDESKNIITIIKNPNKITGTLIGISILLIFVFILLIRKIQRYLKKNYNLFKVVYTKRSKSIKEKGRKI